MYVTLSDCGQLAFREITMPSDGSCLFHTIDFFINGRKSTDGSFNIRRRVVDHVLANWEIFKVWTHDVKGANFTSPDHYRREMMKPSTYGSSCELIAASEMFCCVFKVYRDCQLLYKFGPEGAPVYRLKFSGHLSGGHFDAYEPVTNTTIKTHTGLLVDLKNHSFSKPIEVSRIIKTTENKCNRRSIFQPIIISNSSFGSHDSENTLEPKIKRSKWMTTSQDIKSSKIAPVQPESVLEVQEDPLSMQNHEKNNQEKKRAKRRGRFSDEPRLKQLRKASAKYKIAHPEVNRAAVAKYTQENPEVNRAAVAKYDKTHQKRLQRKKKVLAVKENSGYQYDPTICYESDESTKIGKMDVVCNYCKALKWKGESKGMCCSGGKVDLNCLEIRPEPLHSLIVGNHPDSEHFLNNSRKYNSAFQMTSFGGKQIVEGGFMPTFKVEGQVYHLIGSLLPPIDDDYQFLQLYFIGNESKETDYRCNVVPGIKPELVNLLQNMLHKCNIYVMDFKCAVENNSEENKPFQVVIHAEKKPGNAHRGRYNEPIAGEVGAVIVGQEFNKRDIVLKGRDSRLQRICETHRAYDALQYPLLFCYGEDGYSITIPQSDPDTKCPLQKTVSAASFYSFRLMIRCNEINYLLYFRGLLNQFLVDIYAKIETERLNFIRNNQKKLRAESYIHLKDAISKTDTNPEDLGQVVILPSTFTGGARYMHERTQDAMTYVRHYGRPDLFITFTCNPKWDEINEALFMKQKPQDRHDLISRVFHLKVKTMIDLLTKANIFGPHLCYMFTIEWQKRGLPHAHILLWLKNKIKPDKIDDVICAEIPDPQTDTKLHDIVKSTMIHGPCGNFNNRSPCMDKGSCRKQYPRPLIKETQTGDDGYPKYRRRAPSDGGHTFKINKVTVDNSWVVPYNPVLSRIFNAHINVEFCNSVKSIKYVCKYVNKGSDQAVFSLNDQHDEVTQYETGRYISSSEAAWRIFCFPIHERYPPVLHLAVHLENGQRVYFTSENVNNRINNPKNTTLLGFFELCQQDNFAKGLLYCEVPAYYVWKSNKFVRRKQGVPVPGQIGIKKDNVLGRVYTVHPNNVECYYLRLLLHEVRGPTSFSYLRTVGDTVHPTFKAACSALGLLEDDLHWDHTLEEAALSESPSKIRLLYAMMIVFCQVSNPLLLWQKHQVSLYEDLKHQMEKDCEGINVQHLTGLIINNCLAIIEKLVVSMGGQRLHNYGLPEVIGNVSENINRDYARELAYDTAELAIIVKTNARKLNDDQKKVYEKVNTSITSNNGKLFFLDAPGGTGKTFLLNLLLSKVRSEKEIAVAVASSGIAATLLEGGRTAHSTFKLPLNLNHNEFPLCNISKQSDMAAVLRDCRLIVWDESTMSHKGAVEALDRTLKDVRNNDSLMGGATVLLAGDFRQTLPVVPRGTRADEVKACIKSSYLWKKTEVMSLRVNMRVHLKGDKNAGEFADLLLAIGDGDFEKQIDGKILIPKQLCTVVSDLKCLIKTVYPDIQNILNKSLTWLSERAILTPKNEMSTEVNNLLLQEFSSETRHYKSLDSVVETEDAVHYPIEFLNTLNPPGMPDHNLILKVGAPIMLLRNLHPPKLCNGTRLVIKSLKNTVIEAVILTGCGKGESVFIPRIPLIPTDMPFQFKRVQFPVRVCFAMTVNKAQGQSLKQVGVNLKEDCFSHGQFYVACSRVSCSDSLTILQAEGRTANVVYKEVFRK